MSGIMEEIEVSNTTVPPPTTSLDLEERKKFLRHWVYWVLLILIVLVFVGIYLTGRDGKKKKKQKKSGEKTRPPPRLRTKLNTPRDKINKQFDGIFSNEIKDTDILKSTILNFNNTLLNPPPQTMELVHTTTSSHGAVKVFH
eukprot:sb/3474137/